MRSLPTLATVKSIVAAMAYDTAYARNTSVVPRACDARVRPAEVECITLAELIDRSSDEPTTAPEFSSWLERQLAKRLTQALHPCPRCGVRPTIDDPCSECAERTHLARTVA